MEENTVFIDYGDGILEERYALASERIAQFPEQLKSAGAAAYFCAVRDFVSLCDEVKIHHRADSRINAALYREFNEDIYRDTFLNPDYAAERLGACGTLLSAWYYELRGIAKLVYENNLADISAMLETTVQLYNEFEQAESDGTDIRGEAFNRTLNDIIYSYLFDYTEELVCSYVGDGIQTQCAANRFVMDIVMNADLGNTGEDSYLYSYGEWITDEERGAAALMNALSEDTVEKMARAYTEGYIRGFAMTGKDITKKSVVNCYMPVGFERFMRAAVRQFEAAGLKAVIRRNPVHMLTRSVSANIRPGYYGAFNAECEYDHKEDMALFWGDKLKSHKLAALKTAYEAFGDELRMLSGNACVEIFGKKGDAPEAKQHSAVFSAHQNDVNREYAFRAHELSQPYVPDEETSFTIIAWPTPSIAEKVTAECIKAGNAPAGSNKDISTTAVSKETVYRELFERFIEINTVPADRWQTIQQHIIDALDQADYVEIRGAGSNRTDMRVMLHELKDRAHETNFENCLSDVNIPAGEVFTSPVLKGTDGVINAGYVYIGGFLFKDLCISFTDGRVSDYSCTGYEDERQGRALIEKVIFRNRERLPLGEFAIGTNTAAYAAARKYGIEDRMPVLIAEKTGPHFAVGDTCYSYEEDIVTYNPDGKRITARENECSALRNVSPGEAYFHVHTDITLPFDELKYIRAVGEKETVYIIEDGRFVLPGTEDLNDAFSILN